MLGMLVVDVQNEFSPGGLRAVPNHAVALSRIRNWAREARKANLPIAWIQHHNRPHESRAFVPGSWGAELTTGMGPQAGVSNERLFVKDVFGAFTYTGVEAWLRTQGVTEVLILGFFAHMCISTSAREALVRGFEVHIDPESIGACDLQDEILGLQSAHEVCRSAILQLLHMGAHLATSDLLSSIACAV